MKNWKVILIGMTGAAAVSLAAAGTSLCFPAFAQSRYFCVPQRQLASPGEAATDSEAGRECDEDGELPQETDPEDGDLLETEEMIGESTPYMDISAENSQEYTVCAYDFIYAHRPMIWDLGEELDADRDLPDSVDVYLDGPEGHMDDCLTFPVRWDLSQVDFGVEGSYTVTGIPETGSCKYPIDLDNAPPLSFTLETARRRTMSFLPVTDGDQLILNYEMDGAPFRLPVRALNLYESTDQGSNWFNISQSRRVCITDHWISISGITADSLFQAVGMNLGNMDSSCSDIVRVSTEDGAPDATILPSGGIRGGEEWNSDSGSNWHKESVPDGPYPILEYKTLRNKPLAAKVEQGNPSSLNRGEFSRILVYYGDAPQGFMREQIRLPVVWDWTPADSIDWNQVENTVIHGTFSTETMEENKDLLDFENMPELCLTISKQRSPFMLHEAEAALFENNTVKMKFCEDNDEPLAFGDISGLTVWCSGDGNETWYKITDLPNVSLTGSTLTVSFLKNQVLRGSGYSFQVEQSGLLPDHEQYSSTLSVSHGIWGLQFGSSAGGERGGGKRQEKPPEGFFDGMGNDYVPGEPAPPETEPPSDHPEPENPPGAEVPPNTGLPRPPSGGSGGNGNGSSAGNSESGAGDSSGKHNLTPKVPVAVNAVIIPASPEPASLPKAPPSGPDGHPADSLLATSGDQAASGKKGLSGGRKPSGGKDFPGGRKPSGSREPSEGQKPVPKAGLATTAAGGPGTEAAAPSSGEALQKRTPHRRAIRFIAGLTAVFMGGAAGYFMIRRR